MSSRSIEGAESRLLFIESLEEYAHERGYQWLYLDTTDDMVAAQRFYAALGYELTPRYNDNPQATIFMRKDLRSSAR